MTDERKAVKYHDRLVHELEALLEGHVCHACANDFGPPGHHAPDCAPSALLREIKENA